jgi:hypothetical protein
MYIALRHFEYNYISNLELQLFCILYQTNKCVGTLPTLRNSLHCISKYLDLTLYNMTSNLNDLDLDETDLVARTRIAKNANATSLLVAAYQSLDDNCCELESCH